MPPVGARPRPALAALASAACVVLAALASGTLAACKRSSTEPATVRLAQTGGAVVGLAGDERFLCWSFESNVSCMPKAGGEPFNVPGAAGKIAVRNGKLYAVKDTLTVTTLADRATTTWARSLSATGFDVDDSAAYVWGAIVGGDTYTRGLFRVTKEKGAEAVLLFDTNWIWDRPGAHGHGPVAVDGDAIYYLDRAASPQRERLHRRDKKTGADVILHEQPFLSSIAVSGAHVYFQTPGDLCRVKKTGGGPPDCELGGFATSSIYEVRGDRLYSRAPNEDPPSAPGYAHNPTGAHLDVCPVRGDGFSGCTRFFADVHGAGLVVDDAGAVFTFRHRARPDAWELVRFTP